MLLVRTGKPLTAAKAIRTQDRKDSDSPHGPLFRTKHLVEKLKWVLTGELGDGGEQSLKKFVKT